MRLAASALLIIGGVLAVLVVVRLGAAVFGWDIASLDSMTASLGHVARAVLLGLAFAVLAVLVMAVPRQGERSLWLRGERGGVLVPLAALQRLAEATALRHPEVVRAEVRLRERDGAPHGSVRLYARPLADVARVRGDIDVEVRAAIDLVIGREATQLDVKPTVLRVRQLKRYLP